MLLVGLVGGVVAVAGMWLVAWSAEQLTGTFDREQAATRAQSTSLPPPERAHSPAPRTRLEDPAPLSHVPVLETSPPPRCEGIFVYIVSMAPRFPEYSAVSIATDGDAPGRFRRVGQSIGDWEVSAIVDDWSGLNPEVWLSRDERVCRAELTGNPARTKVTPRSPVKSRKRKVRRTR